MSIVSVPLFGNPMKQVKLDSKATEGAVLGVNLFAADGAVYTLDQILNSKATTSSIANLSGFTSDDLQEGQFNLYFTDRRAQDAVGSILANSTTVSLAYVAGMSITATLNDLTDSGVGAALVKITRDAQGRISGTHAATTDDLTEGSNLYFTAARADARITAQKGVANGLAPLGSDAKINVSYLPAAVLGQVSYQGTWDASAGTPPTTTPEKGWYYIVTVAGSTDLDGITDWKVGDWAIYNGASWDKVDNTDAIASWNGRTGAVVPASGDYTPAQVGAEPAITAGTTAQVWRGDKTFANNVDGPFGVGTTTPNYGSFGNTVTIQHTLHGALEVASTRADANSVLIGAFSGNYRTNSAGHQRIADIQIVSDGTTANQRGGAFYFYLKPNAVMAEVPVFQIRQDGRVIPGTDNTQTLGSSSNRWSVVYAGTGTINTSDEREKTCVSPLTADELGAAAELARAIGTYQWLASVADKGADNARHHAGLTVQRAIEIMQSHNLDPMRYGFICFDEWDELPEQWADIPEERDADGNVIREASRELVQAYRPAGDRYSFRTDELTLFIARGFAARLDALEAKA